MIQSHGISWCCLHGVLKGVILYYSNPIDMKCPLPFSLSFLVDDLVGLSLALFSEFLCRRPIKGFLLPISNNRKSNLSI